MALAQVCILTRDCQHKRDLKQEWLLGVKVRNLKMDFITGGSFSFGAGSFHRLARELKFSQCDVLMGRSFSQNFSLLTKIGQKLKTSTLDGAYSLHCSISR